MSKFRREQGLTLISIALILGAIAFVTLLVLKIAPIYMNHGKVTNALTALEETAGIQNHSKREIGTLLAKRFNLNYVDHITKDDITITKSRDYLKIQIAYEVVAPIAGNLSVLVEFDDGFELGAT